MLLLLFYLGNEIYAIDSAQVVEIIPRVNLRQLYQVPNYVAGIFNYREKFVPVIDLCHLIQGMACSPSLSTRVIIVKYPTTHNTFQYLGLMAEKVTDTLQKSDLSSDIDPKTANSIVSMGKLLMEQQGTIQLLQVDTLLPDRERNWLLLTAEQRS